MSSLKSYTLLGGPTRLQLESLETYLYLFFYFSFFPFCCGRYLVFILASPSRYGIRLSHLIILYYPSRAVKACRSRLVARAVQAVRAF